MMNKAMATMTAVSMAVAARAAFFSADGLVTDKTPGWRFEASGAKDGRTFNPLEGWYPDKGGKLVSPRIPIPTANAYYRISFTASAPERAYEAIAFYDAAGVMVADNYDVVYPGGTNRYGRVVFAQEGVKEAEVFFQSPTGCTVSDVRFETATAEEAAAWCDEVYARLPPVTVGPAGDAFLSAPKTLDALKTGKPWRILLLGDSIVQDAFHSQFHALVKRAYPKSDVTWLVSVRGSTGCWFYRIPENFGQWVASYRPDCVIVGGISNWPKATDEFPVTGNDAIFEVGERIRAAGAELIVMSPALSVDTRLPKGAEAMASVPVRAYDAAAEAEALGLTGYAPSEPDAGLSPERFAELKSGCAERGWGFVDAFTPTYRWLYESGRPYQFYSRDHVHSGELGKQIIGRVLLAFLRAISTDATPTVETETANRQHGQ